MKNFLKALSLCLLASFAFAQTATYTPSAPGNVFIKRMVRVAPGNEQKLISLLDNYFSKNPTPGLQIALFQIFSHPSGMTGTHEIVHYGSPEAMNNFLKANWEGSIDPKWMKFFVERETLAPSVGEHLTGRVNQSYGETSRLPLQTVTVLNVPTENRGRMGRALKKFYDANPLPPGRRVQLVNVESGAQAGSVLVVNAYKDYLTLWPDTSKMDPNMTAKWGKDWNQATTENGLEEGSRIVYNYSRFLLKTW